MLIKLNLLLQLLLLINKINGNKPNILFVLVDDQDLKLNSLKAMPKTLNYFNNHGIIFNNAFCTTPVCCPSRSSIITGQYLHNNKAINNSISGGCSSKYFQNNGEKHSFATYIQNGGYRTFFSGKYLNTYGFDAAGGVKHIPPGWNDWKGLVGNSKYYNYVLSNNGQAEQHGNNYEQDYLPLVIQNYSLEFINNHVRNYDNMPLMAWLSFPSCHDPSDSAPQYENSFPNIRAPRPPNYNTGNKNKHWFVRSRPHMDQNKINYTDIKYRKRLQTLQSVDDIMENLIKHLDNLNILDNTLIIYTSDHGYHLGEFMIVKDKRMPYEEDIRIPFFVKPSNKMNVATKLNDIVTLIDIAPTLIEVAGLKVPEFLDGKSFLPLINGDKKEEDWRTQFLIEYHGEGLELESTSNNCQFLGESCYNIEHLSAWKVPPLWLGKTFCHCEDARNNTWWCNRRLAQSHNDIYCEFVTGFIEYYNINNDFYQLDNTANELSPETQKLYSQKLNELRQCVGKSCWQ